MADEVSVRATPLAHATGLTRILAVRTRMATSEASYAYDLYVAEEDAPIHARMSCTHFTVLSGDHRRRFIDFAQATRAPADVALPVGLERYERWLAHVGAASAEALALAKAVFPELAGFRGDRIPTLWLPIPEYTDGTHARVWVLLSTGDEPSVPSRRSSR
jgi:hypothetical protein